MLLLFIGFGVKYVNTANWHPFIPPNTGEFGQFGWSGVLRGAGVIFFAFIGFDAVSTAAQEAKNPQRDMPRGIMISLVVCTVLYIAVALVLTGIVHYTKLNVPAPIALGVDSTGLMWLRPIIKLGAIAGLSSTMLVMLLGQPRIFFSMSRDGLLPPVFGKMHPTLQDAVRHDDRHRHRRRARRRPISDRDADAAHVDGDVARLRRWCRSACGCLRRIKPNAASAVQDAVDAMGADSRRADLSSRRCSAYRSRRGFGSSCGSPSGW